MSAPGESQAGSTLPTTYEVDDQQSDYSADEEPPMVVWGMLFSQTKGFDTIELCEDRVVLGRAEDCTVRFTDAVISSKHCIVSRERPEDCLSQYDENEYTVFVEDRSSNGTYVNGVRVGKGNRMAIVHGDRIGITNKRSNVPSYIYHDTKEASHGETQHAAIRERYNLSKVLGSGACGEVHLGIDKESGRKYAVKVISKRRFNSTGGLYSVSSVQLMAEVDILRQLDHPNVVHVHDMVETDDTLYIVLELAVGGDLFDRVSKKERFTGEETQFVFYQLLLAVRYLQDQGVAHRDLKLENVLLSSAADDALVKLTDFGLAKLVGPTSFMKTMCGTPSYQAPEVLLAASTDAAPLEGYDKAVDMWSLGVILYICLTGFPPFAEDENWNKKTLFKQITEGDVQYPASVWDKIPSEARDLVAKLLVVDPKERYTVEQALDHPFMKNEDVIKRVKEKQDRYQRRRLETGPTQTDAVRPRATTGGAPKASSSNGTSGGGEPPAKKAAP